MNEKSVAAISGATMGIVTNIGPEVLKTLMMGAVGALGGLIAKEFWNYLKRKYGRN
ncbi:hypothetical protein KTO58_01290 [Chitinophaga pendula]|uniref:hypothetical protein n=1 Tax=Chitinophaga TaxID=79328 RepID=UPI0012FDA11D|nr:MULTISPECIES: hypothetical protein [Chitinophaga]UCJ07840.1 hypothetical protein KTO58_01290 [Chitinophaga pendula]